MCDLSDLLNFSFHLNFRFSTIKTTKERTHNNKNIRTNQLGFDCIGWDWIYFLFYHFYELECGVLVCIAMCDAHVCISRFHTNWKFVQTLEEQFETHKIRKTETNCNQKNENNTRLLSLLSAMRMWEIFEVAEQQQKHKATIMQLRVRMWAHTFHFTSTENGN